MALPYYATIDANNMIFGAQQDPKTDPPPPACENVIVTAETAPGFMGSRVFVATGGRLRGLRLGRADPDVTSKHKLAALTLIALERDLLAANQAKTELVAHGASAEAIAAAQAFIDDKRTAADQAIVDTGGTVP